MEMRSGVILLALAGLAAAAKVPSGTQLEIRLASALNSSTAKAGQAFDALVIAPVLVDGQIAVAAGVKVAGHIQEVKAAVKPEDQAVLALAFEKLSDASGKHAALAARLVSVDNARESVDKDGRILGIIASQTGSGRLDQGIQKVTEKYPGLGDVLQAVKGAVVKETDANIDYEAGVEMTIELTKALEWTGDASGPNVQPLEPQDELAALVNGEPFRTQALKPARDSDLTNLMFLGSRQDLEQAFQKAGWWPADQLNAKSKLETFRAMTEQRGYREAPVSILMLDGKPPDLAFEKLTDTFNARHHLRIWHRPETFHGKEVWVCSATHDTGIDFSEENRTFIHKIDSNIDHERAKVVNDLLFTGLVQGLSLVDRPQVPMDAHNATGDKLQTDGRMAVLSF